jgi:hypothetical protein
VVGRRENLARWWGLDFSRHRRCGLCTQPAEPHKPQRWAGAQVRGPCAAALEARGSQKLSSCSSYKTDHLWLPLTLGSVSNSVPRVWDVHTLRMVLEGVGCALDMEDFGGRGPASGLRHGTEKGRDSRVWLRFKFVITGGCGRVEQPRHRASIR